MISISQELTQSNKVFHYILEVASVLLIQHSGFLINGLTPAAVAILTRAMSSPGPAGARITWGTADEQRLAAAEREVRNLLARKSAASQQQALAEPREIERLKEVQKRADAAAKRRQMRQP